MSLITEFINLNEETPATLENLEKRVLYVTFLPLQANASSGKDDNDKITSWFQLVSTYQTTYDRVDEQGNVYDDENSTQKVFTFKVGYDYMKKYGLSTTELIKFFKEFIVRKRFITLPIIEETPVFEYKNNQRNLVKNQSQGFIHNDFDLHAFITAFKSKSKK